MMSNDLYLISNSDYYHCTLYYENESIIDSINFMKGLNNSSFVLRDNDLLINPLYIHFTDESIVIKSHFQYDKSEINKILSNYLLWYLRRCKSNLQIIERPVILDHNNDRILLSGNKIFKTIEYTKFIYKGIKFSTKYNESLGEDSLKIVNDKNHLCRGMIRELDDLPNLSVYLQYCYE